MLEKMGAFFDNRLSDYDEHQMTCIACAEEFYPYTAEQLPREAGFSKVEVLKNWGATYILRACK